MERSAAFTPDASSSSVRAPRPPASDRVPDLPGCESVRLPASAPDAYDGRFEFWDGRTETAWKPRPCSDVPATLDVPQRPGRESEREGAHASGDRDSMESSGAEGLAPFRSRTLSSCQQDSSA